MNTKKESSLIGTLWYCEEYNRILKVCLKNTDSSDGCYLMQVLHAYNKFYKGSPKEDWCHYPEGQKHLEEGKNYINWNFDNLIPLVRKTKLSTKIYPNCEEYDGYLFTRRQK